MNVTFRADASIEIGTGHVMRCLTLAQALGAAGVRCSFITRELPGHLAERIERAGFAVKTLPPPSVIRAPSAPWASVGWQQDAAETTAALDPLPDWLVLDHYGLDARWQRAVMQNRKLRLMVIDDLADRPHHCTVLLDQNLGRRSEDYDALVPKDCTRLIGPDYALLRPEFAERRAQALARRAGRGLQHLLITIGGSDPRDATSAVLQALQNAALPAQMRITVVMGAQAPALERVRMLASALPWAAVVVVDVNDMAARMQDADLAIGAGGATTWERCALGLPSIVVQIAENQSGIARAMVEAGAALDPGPVAAPDFAPRLRAALAEAQARLLPLSERAAQVCDGDGLGRVVSRLLPAKLGFRPAQLADSRRIWDWRAASGLEQFSLSGQLTPYPEHHIWFTRALDAPTHVFRILLLGEWPCGYLRLDQEAAECARVSICLAPDARGQGLSAALLREAERLGHQLKADRLHAEIHPQNVASLRCFEQAGYARGADCGAFRTYQLDLGKGP